MSVGSWGNLLDVLPVMALAFFRIAGIMLFAPLFGSGRVPKQVKVFIALALEAAMGPSINRPANLPHDAVGMTIGIAGEIAFGLAIGTILSAAFVAAQWGGQIISQQMG